MTTPHIIQTIIDFILLAAVILSLIKEDKIIKFEDKLREVIRKK